MNTETTPSFSIDSIKELMDGFDPASLLPELDSVFGKIELVCRVAVMIGPVLLLLLMLAAIGRAQEESRFRVATYNVENLFDTIPSPYHDDSEFLPDAAKAWHARCPTHLMR